MKQTILLLTAIFMVLLSGVTVQSQYYGESLGESEQLAVANTFQHALENNKSGTAATWNNPDAALSGSTVPLRTFQTTDGVYCREYQQLIVINGKEELGFGTACRQVDGSWRIVDPDSVQEASQDVNKKVRVYQYKTYRYYDPWVFNYPYPYPYYPYNISFSFGFFHHDGYYYSGYLRGNKHHFRGSQKHFRGNRKHFRGDQKHFRGNRKHFRGDQKHFRGNKKHFRGDQKHFRGDRKHFRGDQKHFRGNKKHFRGDQKYFRGNKKHFRGDQKHFRGNKEIRRAGGHRGHQ